MQGPGAGGRGRPGLPVPCVFTECLAPGPGLKSPHSSPVNSAEQTVSREGVSPSENVLACPGGSSPARRQRSGLTGPGPHPAQPFFSKSASCRVIKGSVWSELLLSYSGTVRFACVTPFHSLRLSVPQSHTLYYRLVSSVNYWEGRLGETPGDTAPPLTSHGLLRCLQSDLSLLHPTAATLG